jgi:hypothetical protein
MAHELIIETLRLRQAIMTKWSLSLDQMATIMGSLHLLSGEDRNWVLQEFLTQEFYNETDMKEMFPLHDRTFVDNSVLTWLLSEITDPRQESVFHFQTLMSGKEWHVSAKHSFFCGYLQHPYVCHQRVGAISPWIARLTALVANPAITPWLPTFVKDVHKALPLAFKGKVSNAEPIISFLLHHALNSKNYEELKTWAERPWYLAITEELEKKAAARKRDASPSRAAEQPTTA